MLATVHEITEKVVGQRHITVLRDLGARTAEARTAEEACVISAAMLRPHIKDIPFALLYVTDASGNPARIAASCGVDEGADIRTPVIHLDDSSSQTSPWPLALAHRTGQMQLVKDLSTIQIPWWYLPARGPIRRNARQLYPSALTLLTKPLAF